MVANAGAGPDPIPFKKLDVQILAEGIQYCLTPEATTAAQSIADRMASEQGVTAAMRSWLQQLPAQPLQCDLIPDQPAAWTHSKSGCKLKFSKVAAAALLSRKVVDSKHLQL